MLQQYKELVCPVCRETLNTMTPESLRCDRCRAVFSLKEGIPVFTKKDHYWCNIDRQHMHELLRAAEESGDWLRTVQGAIPSYARAFVPYHRADAQFIFPIDSGARVLDAGSMWGGLAVPIAQFCREVYAVDQTWETLRLLDIRATQMGLHNIRPIVSSIHRLPFPDRYFDFIVVNGVLEWLGMDEDVVIERDWTGRRENRFQYKRTPEEMQEAALREFRRVLKKSGSIYIAIENRIGLQYFFGYPDDHVNVRFVTILPRRIANAVTRLVRNCDYRTYIYSPGQLEAMLRRCGFEHVKLYSAHPHYGKFARLVPFSLFDGMRAVATAGYWDKRVAIFSMVWKLIPKILTRQVSPSLAVVATSSSSAVVPRVVRLMEEVGVIDPGRSKDYDAAVVNSRYENGNSIHHVIWDLHSRKPVFFCKIGRVRNDRQIVDEANLLIYAKSRIGSTALACTIPSVLYHGVVNGMPVQVSSFMSGVSINSGVWAYIRRMDKAVHLKDSHIGRVLTAFRKYATRQWLRDIDRNVRRSLEWLVEFQRVTTDRMLNVGKEYGKIIDMHLEGIHRNDISVGSVMGPINDLKTRIAARLDVEVPVCMEHGDFDVCNILQSNDGLAILDFEHGKHEGLPWFDLGTLIFSPLVIEWKTGRQDRSLRDYCKESAWQEYLERWVVFYADRSGLDRAVLQDLPSLVALEQNAKRYPDQRDPYTYPLFGETMVSEMVGWQFVL
jgi:ubiquinone/menaquinone biosynthesis C-methylase UbiE/uncharacterized protein YbaR (Trm112 family)